MYVGNQTTNWSIQESMICASFTCENSRITSFSPKNVFQAVDRNDTEWVSTQGKPSTRYEELTLEASGTVYTAPANGWYTASVTLRATSASENFSSLDFINLTSQLRIRSVEANVNGQIGHYIFIPCKKGDALRVTYKGTIEDEYSFIFVYDEGVK